MKGTDLAPYVDRLCAVEKRINDMLDTEGPVGFSRTELNDLLWEAADLASAITMALCLSKKVWAQLDLLAYAWRCLYALAVRARAQGVIDLPLERLVSQAFEDTELLFSASEIVDNCQLELLAKPEDPQVRSQLLASVNLLAQSADRWFMHGLLGRSEAYFNASHMILHAVECRCVKERSALIAQ